MRAMVTCRCCVPGCMRLVRLMPFLTVTDALDLIEGICRQHLRLVKPDLRAVLVRARLEFRLCPCVGEFILFFRAWEAVKNLAIERAGRRMAA